MESMVPTPEKMLLPSKPPRVWNRPAISAQTIGWHCLIAVTPEPQRLQEPTPLSPWITNKAISGGARSPIRSQAVHRRPLAPPAVVPPVWRILLPPGSTRRLHRWRCAHMLSPMVFAPKTLARRGTSSSLSPERMDFRSLCRQNPWLPQGLL